MNNIISKTTFECKICKREWGTKVFADFCESICRKNTPISDIEDSE